MFPERLFRYRYTILIGALFILVYCNLYGWLYVPFAPYQFNWRPDHQLHVSQVDPTSIAASYLKQGDHILAINDRSVHRSATFFPPTITKSEYKLTIQRGEHTFSKTVPYLQQPDAYAYQLRLAAGILSLLCWLVGAIVLRFSWRDHQQAILLGYIFVLMSIVVVSWNATLLGVPLAWLTAQPLIFLLASALIYLGMLPYYKPLSNITRKLLQIVFGSAALMGSVAFFEGAFLFPRGTSFDALIGLSMYKLSAASLAVGGLSIFILLVVRRLLAQVVYLRQQLSILLIFVGIGFLPAVFLSFVPLAFWDKPIVPMPIAIVAIIFVPLGYVYVIYRHTYLNLDGTVGRSLPYLLLVLILTTIYGLSLRVLDARFNQELNLILPAVLLFLLLGTIAPAASDWLSGWFHTVIFGRTLETHSLIRKYTLDLAHQPDVKALQEVVAAICKLLDVKKTTLMMKNGGRLLHPTVQIGEILIDSQLPVEWLIESTQLRAIQQRTDIRHEIFSVYPWAEIALPIFARKQLLGVWVLGRPDDGYYHQESIAFLEHAAGTVAMGSEIIFLLDSAEKLSRRILAVQDSERRTFASKLHDNPLQRISFLQLTIGELRRQLTHANDATTGELEKVSSHLGQLESELRELYEMAYPLHVEHGIEMTIQKHINDLSEGSELEIKFESTNLEHADNHSDIDVARIVDHILREAFNNIRKHSQATEVHVNAICDSAQLHLTITDNGSAPILKTFSQPELLRQRHFGIVGMIAWAKHAGGSLEIAPVKDGTQVRLQTPLVMP